MYLWLSSNIQHQAQLWLQVLTYPLEKPLMRINLSIISLFYSKNEIDSSTFEDVISQAKVPGADHEHVDYIGWDLSDSR